MKKILNIRVNTGGKLVTYKITGSNTKTRFVSDDEFWQPYFAVERYVGTMSLFDTIYTKEECESIKWSKPIYDIVFDHLELGGIFAEIKNAYINHETITLNNCIKAYGPEFNIEVYDERESLDDYTSRFLTTVKNIFAAYIEQQ